MSLALQPDDMRGLTIAQFVLSIIGLVFSITGFFLLATVLIISPSLSELTSADIKQLGYLFWVILVAILLLIPSLVFSLRRLRGKTSPRRMSRRLLWSTLAFLLVPLLLFASTRSSLVYISYQLNGLLSILLVVLPLWWFIELGRVQLDPGSPQQQWGISAFTSFLSLPFVLFVEILVIMVCGGFGLLWLVQQPEFSSLLQRFDFSLLQTPDGLDSLQVKMEELLPLFQRPEVILAGIFTAAVVIPIIEELLKPLALWVLMKRDLSPAQGFIAGMICGASFALFESVFSLSAIQPDDWLYTIIGRIGTGLLHVFTSGLAGWALASTWRDGKFTRLGFAFLGSVLLHGTWNFFALFMGLGQVADEIPGLHIPALTPVSTWVLFGLGGAMLVSLIVFNRYLHSRRSTNPSPPLTPPPLSTAIP